MAMIEWEQIARAEVVNVAAQLLSVPVPSVIVPSLKVTVPVGVPLETVTVAVKVTAWPLSDGFREGATEVKLGSLVVFSNIETLLLFPLATAKSTLPSALKSAAATDCAPEPAP